MWNKEIPNDLACAIKEYLHTSSDIDSDNYNYELFDKWKDSPIYIKVDMYWGDYIEYAISVLSGKYYSINADGIRMIISSSWTKAINNIEAITKAVKEILKYINRKDQFDWFVDEVKYYLKNTDKLVELEDSGLLRW